jgi:electron transfer flavoprotein beta subunit
MINPADNCALEEAMSLKDSIDAEVVAITLGPARAETVLKFCLARGADRAIHIECPPNRNFGPWVTSKILSQEILKFSYDLILCGVQSLDTCNGLVGPVLAELLDVPQVTRAFGINLDLPNTHLIIRRLLERGSRQIIQCRLPALITISESANTPYYISEIRTKRVSSDFIEKRKISPSELPEERCQVQMISSPRPRPQKIAGPDSKMTAAERMKFFLKGTSGAKRDEANIFKGSPDVAAERIINFLSTKKMIELNKS